MTDQELVDMLGWRAEQRWLAREGQRQRQALADIERRMSGRGAGREARRARGKPASPLAFRRALILAGAVLLIALAIAIQYH